MKLIITRHGETEENRIGIIQGHLQGVLSELGKEQAEKLANRLKDEKIDLIISSDLARALDTAKTIAKFHTNINLVLDEKLRERFLGKFQGKSKKACNVPLNVHVADYLPHDNSVEDFGKFFARAKLLVDEIIKGSKENILLVGHNGICKAIVANLLGFPDLKKVVRLENASVSIFEKDREKWNIIELNDTNHLE